MLLFENKNSISLIKVLIYNHNSLIMFSVKVTEMKHLKKKNFFLQKFKTLSYLNQKYLKK